MTRYSDPKYCHLSKSLSVVSHNSSNRFVGVFGILMNVHAKVWRLTMLLFEVTPSGKLLSKLFAIFRVICASCRNAALDTEAN
jgi:hypothetical protein